MTSVHVVGVGMTDFGKAPDTSPFALGREAVWAALSDAGVDPDRVDVAAVGHVYQGPSFGQRVLGDMGLTGIPIINVENACASGGQATAVVASMIMAGQADVGIAMGAEKLTGGGGFLPVVAQDLESSQGRVLPAAFAMMAQLYMQTYGATAEQLAAVSVKNSRNASLNPRVPAARPHSLDEVLDSPLIAEPLRRLMCCPVSDGAAAVVMVSERLLKEFDGRHAKLAASVINSGLRTKYGISDIVSEMSERAARDAYKAAGIGPQDVDVCETHDPFSIAEIVHYEDLGFCARGEGARFAADGRSEIDGDVAVSPSGGLLAKGHPLGATGTAQIAEIFWQLLGEAGDRQVPNARVGLAHALGGGVTGIEGGACSVHILTK
ncbi:thiolase family protein [Candidatus Poriferisocius sp.]|uniref:thiolase family protein n=1 Tax=Candidatus Poriferisocius sp. TaxID=3101276 RepID=UPI003B5C8354